MRTRSTALPLTAIVIAMAALLAAGCSAPSTRSASAPDLQRSADAHVARATAAAGIDLGLLMPLCKPPAAAEPSQEDSDHAIARLIGKPRPQPGQAFDGVYFLGADWVSAWAIKTTDGIILIDGLNNTDEATTQIEVGMRKLGLDPAQIKTIIVTHGHGDHYGGASYLAAKYKARIVMSDADWTMTETKLEFDTPLWDKPPKRDISVKDGDIVTLGDTRVTLYLTPGHTMGTLSPVFDVTDRGQPHRVMLWGGTAFNFGNKPDRLDAYIASAGRMKTIVAQQNIDVLISNHAGWDNAIVKLRQKQQAPDGPNPFIGGTTGVDRALTVMGECALATKDRYALRGMGQAVR